MVGRIGYRIGGRGPSGRANRVAEVMVVEVLALGVEFEERVGVVDGVGLGSGIVEVGGLRIH